MSGPKPLANDFTLLSPGARHPNEIYLAKQLAEIRRELDYRRRFYGDWVNKGRLTELAKAHEIAMFEEIEHDFVALQRLDETGIWSDPGSGDEPLDIAAVHDAWQAKVRALRREIMLRRNTYRKRVDQGRMSPEDATKHLERIEAVHWRYWMDGFRIVPAIPGMWCPGHPAYASDRAVAARTIVRAHADLLATETAEAA